MAPARPRVTRKLGRNLRGPGWTLAALTAALAGPALITRALGQYAGTTAPTPSTVPVSETAAQQAWPA